MRISKQKISNKQVKWSPLIIFYCRQRKSKMISHWSCLKRWLHNLHHPRLLRNSRPWFPTKRQSKFQRNKSCKLAPTMTSLLMISLGLSWCPDSPTRRFGWLPPKSLSSMRLRSSSTGMTLCYVQVSYRLLVSTMMLNWTALFNSTSSY